MSKWEMLAICCAVTLIIIFFTSIVYLTESRPAWVTEAVERGYGQYCPNDGRFAWKGECLDE